MRSLYVCRGGIKAWPTDRDRSNFYALFCVYILGTFLVWDIKVPMSNFLSLNMHTNCYHYQTFFCYMSVYVLNMTL